MTNNDVIRIFVNGTKNSAMTAHLGFIDNKLVNYSTTICMIDREEKAAAVNVKKYSTTTSKIQSALLRELKYAGYTVNEYEGEECYYWNCGYQGASKMKREDIARA